MNRKSGRDERRESKLNKPQFLTVDWRENLVKTLNELGAEKRNFILKFFFGENRAFIFMHFEFKSEEFTLRGS
jgi:hypothetical protein